MAAAQQVEGHQMCSPDRPTPNRGISAIGHCTIGAMRTSSSSV
jgi:hypothetical protein